MLKIGIIGAGSISVSHIEPYLANENCEIKSIADINIEQARKRAKEYNIENVYADYHEILNDDSIDAVSIVTPTFTHKEIILESLKSGKHILCEKPPALNAKDAAECRDAAKKYGKCLMFGLVCRFKSEMKFMKQYIDSGKMGKILCGEAVRMHRCDRTQGWFLSKSKAGGGPLIDAAIHELDDVLYLMGYPKPKAVLGFTSDINKDLPQKIKGMNEGWVSADTRTYERNVENVASGFVTFDNGAYLFIKTSTVLHTVTDDTYVELSGEKAGARLEPFNEANRIKLLECSDDYYLREVKPVIADNNFFQEEIDHFVDCCINGTECICKLDECVTLMKIIDAIYKSAETGETIYF